MPPDGHPPSPRPKEDEIVVHKPPGTSTPADSVRVLRKMNTKISHPFAAVNSQSTHTKAEQLMINVLQRLQKIYNEAREAEKAQITIERTTFEAIVTNINEVGTPGTKRDRWGSENAENYQHSKTLYHHMGKF
jgi:hypothetical protein